MPKVKNSRDLRMAGEHDFLAGKPITAFYSLLLKRHNETARAEYEIGWRSAADAARRMHRSQPLIATGWPCKTFIGDPIYRRIRLGLDVQITKDGITLREQDGGIQREVTITWKHLCKYTRGWRRV